MQPQMPTVSPSNRGVRVFELSQGKTEARANLSKGNLLNQRQKSLVDGRDAHPNDLGSRDEPWPI